VHRKWEGISGHYKGISIDGGLFKLISTPYHNCLKVEVIGNTLGVLGGRARLYDQPGGQSSAVIYLIRMEAACCFSSSKLLVNVHVWSCCYMFTDIFGESEHIPVS
jgi:hypothetical protein